MVWLGPWYGYGMGKRYGYGMGKRYGLVSLPVDAPRLVVLWDEPLRLLLWGTCGWLQPLRSLYTLSLMPDFKEGAHSRLVG